MKILDTFPFSEPYETDILLLKLQVEDQVVDEWIIVENSYTFQGEYKGLFAEEIIGNDDRFAEFRHKIKVISSNHVNEYVKSDSDVNDEKAFIAEYRQRDLSREYILKKYGDSDAYVFLSDADEILSVPEHDRSRFRRKCFVAYLLGVTRLVRKRYWFDFDNLWPEKRTTPLVHINYLKKSKIGFGPIRRKNVVEPFWGHTFVYEFSYCFRKEDIIRKYETFSHTGFTNRAINQALENNHIAVRDGCDVLSKRSNFLIKIRPSTKNLPLKVVEGFDYLKTDSVNPDYVKSRLATYGDVTVREKGRVIKFLRKIRDNLR